MRTFWIVLPFLVFMCACGSSSDDGKLSRLQADGKNIVDSEGQVVRLRGVNLGGWMFHETWITQVGYSRSDRILTLAKELALENPIKEVLQSVGIHVAGEESDDFGVAQEMTTCPTDSDLWKKAFETALGTKLGADQAATFLQELAKYPSTCDDSEINIRRSLEQRFGREGRESLYSAFQDIWIQESDIAWLAAQGFTVVRVPIGYRSITTGSDFEKPTALLWNEKALAYIDRLLDWCEKHNVYAIIDMQEAPGGQNNYSNNEENLYDDPKMQELTIEMWKTLAARFSKRNIVAAYSLLAEPYGAKDEATRDTMYDRLIKALRAQGDDHLMIVHDGFRGMSSLPNPATYQWTNVVYSTHFFEWKQKDLKGYQDLIKILYEPIMTKAQNTQQVPYFIGSFSTFKDETWAYDAAAEFVNAFERSAWSWTVWTYKRIDNPDQEDLWNFHTSWGVRGRLAAATTFVRPDLQRDNLETLMSKIQAFKNLVLDPNPKLLEKLTAPMKTAGQ